MQPKNKKKYLKRKYTVGNSLVAPWLRLCASTPWEPVSVPGWRTKIPDVTWHSQEKERKYTKYTVTVKHDKKSFLPYSISL